MQQAQCGAAQSSPLASERETRDDSSTQLQEDKTNSSTERKASESSISDHTHNNEATEERRAQADNSSPLPPPAPEIFDVPVDDEFFFPAVSDLPPFPDFATAALTTENDCVSASQHSLDSDSLPLHAPILMVSDATVEVLPQAPPPPKLNTFQFSYVPADQVGQLSPLKLSLLIISNCSGPLLRKDSKVCFSCLVSLS